MTCSSISYDQHGGCNKRPKQWVICIRADKTENHIYRVNKCRIKKGKSSHILYQDIQIVAVII